MNSRELQINNDLFDSLVRAEEWSLLDAWRSAWRARQPEFDEKDEQIKLLRDYVTNHCYHDEAYDEIIFATMGDTK